MASRQWGVVFVILWAAAGTASTSAAGRSVQVVPKEAERRVDVLVDGQPFTSYIWPTSVKKPVLFPLRTDRGVVVTRGFPLEPRPREHTDHPHHVGLWLNYGDVNGVDFWGNAGQPSNPGKMGAIIHRKVESAKSGVGRGELVVGADWVVEGGKALLSERTRYGFGAAPGLRSIDRITTLTALGEKVVFRDTKEGMFGMRVARALEQPATKPEVFTDASGRATTVPVLDNEGVTGLYLSSEGKTGDAVWGTRARWVRLSGKVEGQPVTVAMLDHPKNPGHPTHWHARGYGLFAANPLGQKDFPGTKGELNFSLEPGQSATFTYRVLILSEDASPQRREIEYQRFIEDVRQ
jgi:hypothetical protein